MIEARKVDPEKEDLRYLDGPWRNDACNGYALMAMHRIGLDDGVVAKVMAEMTRCFDDATVKEAAQYYCKGGR